MASDIRKQVEAVVDMFGCTIDTFASETPDTIQVIVKHPIPGTDEWRFGCRFIDTRYNFIDLEVRDLCKQVRASAWVPAEVPIVELGAQCPEHPKAMMITAINLEAWTCACAFEHQMPERIAQYEDRDGQYLLHRKA